MLRRPVREHGGSRLLGFGSALPEHQLDAADLTRPFGRDAAWLGARTGIETLRRVRQREDVVSLAVRAGRDAIVRAGLDEGDIDLVVTASCSVGAGLEDIGALAGQVAPRAATMQVNSACSGFCYAVSTADSLIRAGSARHVLVLAAEAMSTLIDPSDLGTSILFGDGAGAAVLGPARTGSTGVGPAVWGSDGSQAEVISCGPAVGGRMQMAGRQVFRWAVETMPKVALEACERAGVAVSDIDVFVPHQANLRIVHGIADRLGLARAVIADSVRSVGNTSAASVPIALTELMAQQRARAGQLALLLGFGAGLSYAGQVVVLP